MIYHPKIEFRNRSNYDEKLIVSTFNPDSGETDTYLTMEPVYSESYDGAMRTDYGAKYTDVARPSVTFIDIDGEDIQPYKVRSVLRWLTGSRQNAWMNVYNIDGDIVCSYLGRFTDVKLQKMDARVIGIVAYFTATTPWAYSDVQTVTMQLNGATNFSIDNESDELYSLIYPRIIYKNAQNDASLSIKNNTVGEETVFKKLQQGEIITIDNNFVAYSDNTSRIFNDDFNFVFPALSAGLNDFKAEGIGELTISFRYPMKVSDGLLNSYEIKNKLIVYVDNHIVRIKGNTNLEPPTGINIKIMDESMIVRGNLKNVKIMANEPILNVTDGRLIINKQFDDAQISK